MSTVLTRVFNLFHHFSDLHFPRSFFSTLSTRISHILGSRTDRLLNLKRWFSCSPLWWNQFSASFCSQPYHAPIYKSHCHSISATHASQYQRQKKLVGTAQKNLLATQATQSSLHTQFANLTSSCNSFTLLFNILTFASTSRASCDCEYT